MTNYYTLMVYEVEHNKWFNHFGDYDKDVVKDEMDDLANGYEGLLKKNMKIVKSSDDQNEIDLMLKKANGEV